VKKDFIELGLHGEWALDQNGGGDSYAETVQPMQAWTTDVKRT